MSPTQGGMCTRIVLDGMVTTVLVPSEDLSWGVDNTREEKDPCALDSGRSGPHPLGTVYMGTRVWCGCRLLRLVTDSEPWEESTREVSR